MEIASATSSNSSFSSIMSDRQNNTTAITEVDNNNNNDDNNNLKNDDHEHGMLMPGFRFHPTEEELVEFYLRRKVEGKRFNVELITFLDLYRYDPWELPALAASGEKEWLFYVPRERKYRNGDRPNRVTTSGYWKATGADRTIRTDNFRSIGLKKTLVFYSGKAPKGIRTSWIMNEYRLLHHETAEYQKAEISLCRVYKRAGIEDHHSLPNYLPSRLPSSSSTSCSHKSDKKRSNQIIVHHKNVSFGEQASEQIDQTYGSSNASNITTTVELSKHNMNPSEFHTIATTTGVPLTNPMEEQPTTPSLVPNVIGGMGTTFFTAGSSSTNNSLVGDDLNYRLFNYRQQKNYYNSYIALSHPNQFSNFPLVQTQVSMAPSSVPTAFSITDRLWEWNPTIPETNQDYANNNIPFK